MCDGKGRQWRFIHGTNNHGKEEEVHIRETRRINALTRETFLATRPLARDVNSPFS